MIPEVIKDIIEREIKEKRATLSHLAEKSGINKAQLSRFLKSGTGISQGKLSDLAECLDLSIDWEHQIVLPRGIEPHWVERIVSLLRNRQVVAFVGAGISRLAVPRKGHEGLHMPLWSDLIRALCDLLKEDYDEWKDEPLELIEFFCEKRDENELRQVIAYLTDDSPYLPSQIHHLIAALRWGTVVTTNYDHLLERVCAEANVLARPVFNEKDLAFIDPEQRLPIIKIHGDCNHPSDMIITQKDYQDWFARHPIWASKLENLLVEKQWVILGASLDDPNWCYLYDWIKEKLKNLHKEPLLLAYRPTKGETRQYDRQSLKVVSYAHPEALTGLFTLLHRSMNESSALRVPEEQEKIMATLPAWLPRYRAAMEIRYGSFDLVGFYWTGPAYARSDIRLEEIYQPPRISLIEKVSRQESYEKARGDSAAHARPQDAESKSVTSARDISPDYRTPFKPIPQSEKMDESEWAPMVAKDELRAPEYKLSSPEPALVSLPRFRTLVVLGDPGSGKSLLLRRSLLLAMESNEGPLPVMLPLRQWAQELEKDSQLTLERFALKHLSQLVDISQEAWVEYFERGHVWWLLDGLDEVRQEITGPSGVRFCLLDHLSNVAQRRPGDRFTVTSRPSGYRQAPLPHPWQESQILLFEEKETLGFFERWFDLIRRKEFFDLGSHSKVYEQAKGHPGLKDLLSNPLLLTLIILFYKGGRELPKNRREFYQYAFNTLGDRWLAAKQFISGQQFPRRDVLDPILARAGYGIQSLGVGRGLASREHLTLWAKEALLERGLISSGMEMEVALFLSVASSLIGIVVEQAPGYFGFLHLSFQEYAAALYLSRHLELAKTNMRFLTYPQWEEVWKLFFQEIGPSQQAVKEILAFLLRQDEIGMEKTLHRPLLWAIRAICEGSVETKEEEILILKLEKQLSDEAVPSSPVLVSLLKALSSCPRLANKLVNVFLKRLTDLDLNVLFAAAEALSSVAGEPEVKKALLERLTDKDGSVRSAATRALSSVAHEPEVKKALLKRLSDKGWGTWSVAAEALSTFASDPAVKKALLDQFAAKGFKLTIGFYKALSRIAHEPEVKKALLERLTDKEEDARFAAIVVLTAIAGEPEVKKALLERLTDKDGSVRSVAADILSVMATEPEVKKALLERLTDKDGSVRSAATRALFSVASEPEVRKALLERLTDQEGDVRSAAARALSSVASEPEVKKALLERLTDKDGSVRSAATRALSSVASEPEVRKALLERLTDQEGDVRSAAARALSSVANKPEVQKALLERLTDQEGDVRSAAVEALSSAASESEVKKALLERLMDQDEKVQSAATRALSSVAGEPEVKKALLELADKDWRAFEAVWDALYPLPLEIEQGHEQ